MSLPGFLPEVFLHSGGAHYQGRTMLAGARQEGDVIPSAGVAIECNCWNRGRDTVCSCYWSVGGSGGMSTCDKKSCRTINW
jgi:hypothetical protein